MGAMPEADTAPGTPCRRDGCEFAAAPGHANLDGYCSDECRDADRNRDKSVASDPQQR